MTPQNLLVLPLSTPKLSIGCPILDGCMGGGIPCNSITELVGESGSGKTQVCLQLTIRAQLPPSHGGLGGSSLYIHTEFSFPIRRLQQLANHYQASHANLIGLNPLEDIYVHAIHDAQQMVHVLRDIEAFMGIGHTRLPVKLIVIDSIAALFGSQYDRTPADLKRRSEMFFKISGKLKALANKFGVAVVLTNQVVDVIGPADGIDGVRLGNLECLHTSARRVSPALGLAWAHCVNSRVFLSRHEESVGVNSPYAHSASIPSQTQRRLNVVFAPHLAPASSQFVITKEGVVGVSTVIGS
ncbi:DNA repair protein XRCC3 homolog [Prunus dulcis]|uniref:DNA repair protein XRCC3 homolog n=1 Tax=Prunus dulcis TaxID=3755 RepID=A0A4Y1RGA1_PRUDU|nr:DNA repair protein XRCC3 homolog [Prunus dulcis]